MFTVFGLSIVSWNTIAMTTTADSKTKSLPKSPASTDLPRKLVMNAPADMPARFINP